MTQDSQKQKKFGTFAGVFTPTLLTILGVIMYLRLGWVVGNGGLLGGWLIILVSVAITLSTGLSLSSIATNTRLGAGGPYAIISKSLGSEIGGSVGVPLYVSQALAVSMYIFGLREGWNWIFPDHPPILVDLVSFLIIFGIAYASAELAFKIQYVVMGVILLSLVSIFCAPEVWAGAESQPIRLWGDYSGGGGSRQTFWTVFAVFFPAATGIMAGANMSGELANPRKSIPLGTLSAIGISSIVYFALAVWASKAASPEELMSNYNVMIDKAAYGPIVVAGLLGATFSSALASLVGAPRILVALARDGILPKGDYLATLAKNGEPRRGLVLTGVLVLGALMLRDLNMIAPLISMFFLITYAVINCVMLLESTLGLVSFRPTLKLPFFVPLVGAVGCVFAMFIVNPSFSLIAVAFVFALYFSLVRKSSIKGGEEDVRSGVFVAFAEWAAAKVIEYDIVANARAWKPNLLVPVQDSAQLRGEFRLIVDLARPEGSVKLLGLATEDTVSDLTPRIKNLRSSFQKHGVFTTGSVIDSAGYITGIVTGLQALYSAFFRPNVLFLSLSRELVDANQEPLALVKESRRLKIGLAVLGLHPKAGLGREKVVNLWVPYRKEGSLEQTLDQTGLHLGILFTYRLLKTWKAEVQILTVVEEPEGVPSARLYLEELCDLCRMPRSVDIQVLTGSFEQALESAPQSDLDILGLPKEPTLERLHEIVEKTRSACLFVADSGNENALA